MMRVPVPRDLDSFAYPDMLVPGDVVEEAGEPGDAGGMPDHAGVQAHGHHFRPLGALAIETVEGIEVPALATSARGKRAGAGFRIIVSASVGDRQMIGAVHL